MGFVGWQAWKHGIDGMTSYWDRWDDGGDVASAALFLLAELQKCSPLLTQTVGPLSPCWADIKLDWFTLASRKGFCTSKTAVNTELNPHRKQHSSNLHWVEQKQSLIVRWRKVGCNIAVCDCVYYIKLSSWHDTAWQTHIASWSLSVGNGYRFSVYNLVCIDKEQMSSLFYILT